MRFLTLRRAFFSNQETIGILTIRSGYHAPIYTLEQPWMDNMRNISCIPKGTYLCEAFSGQKGETFKILDVRDRDSILMHSGNISENSNGCILVGLSAGVLQKKNAVLQSRLAMSYLRKTLGEDQFVLSISEIGV